MGAEVSYHETAVAPELGAAPICEDGLQKSLPVGAFSVMQLKAKAKAKTRETWPGPKSWQGVWPEVRAAGGWARWIGLHLAKHWGFVSFC